MEVSTIRSPLLEGKEIFVPQLFQDHFLANPGLVHEICEANNTYLTFFPKKIKIEAFNPQRISDVADIIRTIIFNIYNVYLVDIVMDLPMINFGIDEELIFATNSDVIDITLTKDSDRPKIIISGLRKEAKLIEKKIRSHIRKVHKTTLKTKTYHVYFKPHLSVLFNNKPKIFSEIQIITGTKIVVPTDLKNPFLPITVDGSQSDAKIAKRSVINTIKNCVVRYLYLDENYHRHFYWNQKELIRNIEDKSKVVSILFLKQLVTIIGEIKNVDNAVKLIREYVEQLTQFVHEDIPIKSIFHSAISQRNLRRRIKNRSFELIFTFPPVGSSNDFIRVRGSVEDVRKTKKEILRIGNLLEQEEIPVESNSMEFLRIEEINKMKRVARKNNTQITFRRPRADRNRSILIFGQKVDVEHVKTKLQEMLRQIYTEKYVFVDPGLQDSLSYRGFLFKKINFECGNISLKCTKVDDRLAVTVSGDRGVGKAVQILRRASSNFEETVLDEKVTIDPRIVQIELFTNQISYFQKKFDVRIRITNKAAYIRGYPENIFNCKFYLERLQENMLKEYTYKKKELKNGKRHVVNTPKTVGKVSKGRTSLPLSNYEDVSFCRNIRKKEKMLWQRPLETKKKFANCSLNSVMFIR